MPMWGDDKPILTSDNEETKKGKGAVPDKDTFNLIGTSCDRCGGVDGKHQNSCGNNN